MRSFALVGVLGGVSADIRNLQADDSPVKALADQKQCGFGSYCKCDSSQPTCHITNVPCQCFGQDSVSTAVVGSALLQQDALTQVAEKMLDRVRLGSAIRSQIQDIERASNIKQAVRNSVAHRVQSLYEAQLQRAAMLGQVADVVTSFDLVRAIKLKNLMPSVAELAAFKTQLSTDLGALKNAVTLRSTIYDDLNKLAWTANIRDAITPISKAAIALQVARAKQMTDAINALAAANERKQVLRSSMEELVEAFEALEEAEGEVLDKFQPEQEYEGQNRRRLLFMRAGFVGTPFLRTGFGGYPYGSFAATRSYSTLGYAGGSSFMRCFGGFCNRFLW